MDVFTLYVGQGNLSAVRSEGEAIIVDAHMPNCEDIDQSQIEKSLHGYLSKSKVCGLVLTGLDRDHACPAGVDSILVTYQPSWIMYPKYYKDSDSASEVFAIVEREVKRRKGTMHPLSRVSVSVEETNSLQQLTSQFDLRLFSPALQDMNCSNNSSIVLKIKGRDSSSFSYLVTGDTESDRWDVINVTFGKSLKSDVMIAPHHGSLSGANAKTLVLVHPDTVLISAGVDNSYGHPDGKVVAAYQKIAKHVLATNAENEGLCFFTRCVNHTIETVSIAHPKKSASLAR